MINHLVLSSVLLGLAVFSSFRTPRFGWFTVICFFIQWPLIELAWFWAGLSAVFGVLSVIDYLLHSGSLVTTLLYLAAGLGFWRLHRRASSSKIYLQQALEVGLGHDYKAVILPERHIRIRQEVPARSWLHPLSFKHPDVERISNIQYGPQVGRDNLLDIYRLKSNSKQKRPVLLQIHGGGWIIGHKQQQAMPLIQQMAAGGWVVVSINYRLALKQRLPAALIDAKQAVAWIKENIHNYGGDKDFIAVSGGSAGGHLANMIALTANQPQWQPGFEETDTSVQSCVPIYAVYDYLDRENIRKEQSIEHFLERWVMPCKRNDDEELWRQLSPLSWVAEAPENLGFMVIHGQFDGLVWIEEARAFTKHLRLSPAKQVVYVELEDCQHGFEVFHSMRAEHTINAIQEFLEHQYSQYLRAQKAT